MNEAPKQTVANAFLCDGDIFVVTTTGRLYKRTFGLAQDRDATESKWILWDSSELPKNEETAEV